MAFARRFAAFWYDFLVGDHWELFVGPLVALAVVAALLAAGVAPAIGGVLLFVLITAVAALRLGAALRS